MKTRNAWTRLRGLSPFELVVAIVIAITVAVGIAQLGEGLYMRAEAGIKAPDTTATGSIGTPGQQPVGRP